MHELNLVHETSIETSQYDRALRQFLDSRLNQAMLRFSQLLSQHGYEVSVYSKKAIAAWSQISEDQSEILTTQFQVWSDWIQMSEIDIERTPVKDKEILFAKRALRHFGMFAGDSFWKKYQEGEVIEIYGPQMIQLYRSMNFFKLCGYSLLDISVFQWYVLWDRPKIVIDQMLKSVEAVFSESHPAMPANVLKHISIEKMNSGDSLLFTPRATEIEFCHIGILVHEDNRQEIDSFICTSTAATIAEGEDTYRFSVL